jgi:hypothetical protein
MHGAIWRFNGDPDDLLERYDAMLADLPLEQVRLHIAMRTADGLLVVDTCPTEEAFRSVIGGEWFAELRAKHGLPPLASIEDHAVDRAIVDGEHRVAPPARV